MLRAAGQRSARRAECDREGVQRARARVARHRAAHQPFTVDVDVVVRERVARNGYLAHDTRYVAADIYPGQPRIHHDVARYRDVATIPAARVERKDGDSLARDHIERVTDDTPALRAARRNRTDFDSMILSNANDP